MITEDYVSFETAKLLKEKGFAEKCSSVWRFTSDSPKGKGKWILYGCSMADENSIWNPTLQMVMKWLREKYNWHIEICRGPKGYHIWIVTIPLGVTKYITEEVCGKGIKYLDTYEEACEAGIRYCLKNLI